MGLLRVGQRLAFRCDRAIKQGCCWSWGVCGSGGAKAAPRTSMHCSVMVAAASSPPRAPRRSSGGPALEAARGAEQGSRPPPAASREPATGPRRTAVCVAGAARTVAAADVSRALGRFVDGTPADCSSTSSWARAELPRPGRRRARVAARGLGARRPCGCEENPIACGTDAADASSRSRSARRWSGPTRLYNRRTTWC